VGESRKTAETAKEKDPSPKAQGLGSSGEREKAVADITTAKNQLCGDCREERGHRRLVSARNITAEGPSEDHEQLSRTPSSSSE